MRIPALLLCVLFSASAVWADPVGVCVDSRGCGSDGGSSYSNSGGGDYGGGGLGSGRMTQRAWNTANACGNPICWVVRAGLLLPIGVVFDSPVWAVKGLYHGGIYAGKGLAYAGKGIGHGAVAAGKGIGHGAAAAGKGIASAAKYPFNRPPKPMVPPASWEQYKHDVLRRQKMLTRKDPANEVNQVWCVNHIPLAESPNRAGWETRCNGDGFISNSALPVTAMAAPPAPVETYNGGAGAAPAGQAAPAAQGTAAPAQAGSLGAGVQVAPAAGVQTAKLPPAARLGLNPNDVPGGADAVKKTGGAGFDDSGDVMGHLPGAPSEPTSAPVDTKH